MSAAGWQRWSNNIIKAIIFEFCITLGIDIDDALTGVNYCT